MARPRKNEEVTTPWVVRDVPEHIRHDVRVYAAQHDMTMAQAVEAIVESVYRRHDRQLMDALLNMYRHVIADDWEGARREAQKVRPLLERTDEPPSDAALVSQGSDVSSEAVELTGVEAKGDDEHQRLAVNAAIETLSEEGLRAVLKVIEHYTSEQPVKRSSMKDDISGHYTAQVSAYKAIQETDREQE